jgi:hypothetical protein
MNQATIRMAKAQYFFPKVMKKGREEAFFKNDEKNHPKSKRIRIALTKNSEI